MRPGTKVITVEEFKALGAKMRMPGDARNKFHAQPQVFEGHRFDSKAELAFEFHLRLLKAQGSVSWWMRQVPFHLPGGRKYIADFVVVTPFRRDQPLRILDVKGKDTNGSALKRDWVEAHFGQTVELVPAKSDGSYTWTP